MLNRHHPITLPLWTFWNDDARRNRSCMKPDGRALFSYCKIRQIAISESVLWILFCLGHWWASVTYSVKRCRTFYVPSALYISRTLADNEIVDHSDVVGASPTLYRRCSNYIFILDLTPGINRLGKDNCKTRRETLKFSDLARLILEIWRYVESCNVISSWEDEATDNKDAKRLSTSHTYCLCNGCKSVWMVWNVVH